MFIYRLFLLLALISVNSLAQTGENKIKGERIEGVQIGNIVPEISLKDPDGKLLKLSQTRGKLVLLDFWASWCGPCRRENPKLVDLYNIYKDKKFAAGDGFTVFGVSLDGLRDKYGNLKQLNAEFEWKNAIVQDGLLWEYNVSELKGWNSEVSKRFGIRSIPSNFLLDENGLIVAKNLRGERLNKALELAKTYSGDKLIEEISKL